MVKQKLHSFLHGALLVIAVMACVSLLVMNLFYLSRVQYDYTEKVTVSPFLIQSLFLMAGIALLAILAYQCRDTLERVDLKKLYCILSLVYTAIILYFFLNIDPVLRADSGGVHQAAMNARAGIFTDFEKGGYLYRYPHQLGLALYEYVLGLFSANPLWNMLVNYLMVLGINYTALRISQTLFQQKAIATLTLLCSFAFLPQLFFTLFVYGLIPGFFFLYAAFYQALRFAREHRRRNLLALVLFSAGAVVLKSNCAIGVIAIWIYLALHLLKEKWNWKTAAALVCLALCLVLPGKLVKGCFQSITGCPASQGTPMNLYLAMGTDIDNRMRAPGWYNGYVYQVYTDTECDSQAAAQIGKEKLEENLSKILQRPGEAVKFFGKKLLSQWCDPLYQSLWSGPMEDFGQLIHTNFLKAVYHDGLPEDILTVLCKFVTLMIWLGVCAFLLYHGKQTEGWELFLMYFLGGLIFHTFWEGKSQYIYPYVFCLIPCAMAGFWDLSQKMKVLFSSRSRQVTK